MSKVNVYNSKYRTLSGTSRSEVYKKARREYNEVAHATKRQPYIRSKYFNGSKIFLDVFWPHLTDKHQKEQTKRLRFYKAALNLIRNSRITPETIVKEDDQHVLLHRFYGMTKDGIYFCVQIKEDKRSDRRDFMSTFERRPR